MNSVVRTILIFLLGGLAAAGGSAQTLTVDGPHATPLDLSATMQSRNDRNGQTCALIKVQCALDGLEFSGSVIGDVSHVKGEYWVYMPAGTKQLSIHHDKVLPVDVYFDGLTASTTYRLALQLPESLYGLLFNPSINTQPQPAQPEQAIPVQSSVAQQSGGQVEPFTVNGISFNMVRVDGGTFQMGATSEQENPDSDEKPVHSVTLSSYYIGETEVTQELWQAVMGTTVRQQRDKDDKSFPMRGEGPNYPMYYISYDDCQKFIKKLNKLTKRNFRLPTEAEWEFAARGGTKSRGYQYSGSNTIGNVAWYAANSGGNTHPVKQKTANELGLYDMTGNVWEWCADWKGSYSSGSQTNPTGPATGSYRVYRGGCWSGSAGLCRVANRPGDWSPDYRSYNVGLRLALSE